MNDYPLLSVIVPVYNCVEYIERCIDSILAQSYPNLELILIDDGSDDGSGEICDRYSQEHSSQSRMIICYHKQNEGACYARRDGLEMASADYVTFVDGDDWIDSDMYSELMTRMISDGSDIITSGFIFGEGENDFCDTIPEGLYSNARLEWLRTLMIYNPDYDIGGIIMSVCVKIYRKDHILSHMRNLPSGIRLFEDLVYCYLPFFNARNVTVTINTYYHYKTSHSFSHENMSFDNRISQLLYTFGYVRKNYAEFGEHILHQVDRLIISICYKELWHFCTSKKYRRLSLSAVVNLLSSVISDETFCSALQSTLSSYSDIRVRSFFYLLIGHHWIALLLFTRFERGRNRAFSGIKAFSRRLLGRHYDKIKERMMHVHSA